jgi:hypothetical protein
VFFFFFFPSFLWRRELEWVRSLPYGIINSNVMEQLCLHFRGRLSLDARFTAMVK